MVELQHQQKQIKRAPRARGFYVRMKLLPTTKNGGRLVPQLEKKNFFYRYCKWVLWLSLSLYFFSSFLISNHNEEQNKPPTSLSTTHFSTFAARALIESATINNATKQGTLFDGLKVYVYDLPPKYNTDWLKNERCSSHLFASEVAIHRALLTSDALTVDPYEADFFFVPVYVSCNFSTVNGFPAIGHARNLIASAIDLVRAEYPFWERTHGADHVFVAAHDFGSCFHTMEDVAISDGVPGFLKNSIVLQTFGVTHHHPCQEVENVVIPPYVSPEKVRATLESFPITGRRDIFAFFRGKMEVHPKNVSGRFYSKRVRTELWRKYNGDRRFYLQRQRFAGYQSEIARSKFCLCPLGWAPWSPRLVESVALGCVPVIIADGIRLPFDNVVPWAEISVNVAEKDVGKLAEILEHVAATNLTSIQKKLRDPRVRGALLFNDRVHEGDATWNVLSALATKLARSHRRARVSSQ
ncbi:probable glucuronoxylan glucuronosyltransferase IRX7 [Malus sylvestris]|uniref:probable glucuronoxylan glucuronosyltransferase IRX7 n=1 Tax=Malus sylvestris TaxID=3752 RepID=UPI0021AC6F10|nr:probable glucuronoxylan glucuronosyltransferase IRX7 [Malus sylvestris]